MWIDSGLVRNIMFGIRAEGRAAGPKRNRAPSFAWVSGSDIECHVSNESAIDPQRFMYFSLGLARCAVSFPRT
jgi:hypothetical protein